MRNAGAGVPKGPRLSRCPRAHPPFAPSGVLVSHDILPRAARMFSLSLSFPFDFWRSLKTCACTCSLSQGTWAGLGVGAGKDAPSHSHAAQGPGRPPPGPLGDGPGPQQPAWQQAKCLGRALALGPRCLAWARLSQRSSECVCQEGREPSGLVIYKPGTGAGPRAWGHCSLCVS